MSYNSIIACVLHHWPLSYHSCAISIIIVRYRKKYVNKILWKTLLRVYLVWCAFLRQYIDRRKTDSQGCLVPSYCFSFWIYNDYLMYLIYIRYHSKMNNIHTVCKSSRGIKLSCFIIPFVVKHWGHKTIIHDFPYHEWWILWHLWLGYAVLCNIVHLLF